jgi:hypothetical protein
MILVTLASAVAALGLLVASLVRRGEPQALDAGRASSERVALAIAVAWSALTAALLLVVPTYSSGARLIEVNGARVIGPLALPIVVAAAPFALPTARARTIAESAAALVLASFATIAGFSIGLYYIPAVLALLAAGTIGVGRYRPA